MSLTIRTGQLVRSFNPMADSSEFRVAGDPPYELITTEQDLFSRLGTSEPDRLNRLIFGDFGVNITLEPSEGEQANYIYLLGKLGTTEGKPPRHYANFTVSEKSHLARQLTIHIAAWQLAELRKFAEGTPFRLDYCFTPYTLAYL